MHSEYFFDLVFRGCVETEFDESGIEVLRCYHRVSIAIELCKQCHYLLLCDVFLYWQSSCEKLCIVYRSIMLVVNFIDDHFDLVGLNVDISRFYYELQLFPVDHSCSVLVNKLKLSVKVRVLLRMNLLDQNIKECNTKL